MVKNKRLAVAGVRDEAMDEQQQQQQGFVRMNVRTVREIAAILLILTITVLQIIIKKPSVVMDAFTFSTEAVTMGFTTAMGIPLDGTIFYNLFAPTSRRDDIKKIVLEQLIERNVTCPNVTMHYTLIDDRSLEGFVSSECPSCKMLAYRETGNEDDTLQALWEYCQEASDDTLVTYIHDKGSFNFNPVNERARRMATKGAMECRNMMPSDCNICSAVFYTFPQYLCTANMWTARCSYVRRLYRPKDYAAKMQEMYDTTLNHSILRDSPDYGCLRPYDFAENFLGIGRYAYERWPFSHPAVEPCQVLPYGERHAPSNFPQDWTPNPQRAPVGNAQSAGITVGPYKTTFARLKGRLFEWEYVYNETPPKDSWIWDFYAGYEEGTPAFQDFCREKIENFKRNHNASS